MDLRFPRQLSRFFVFALALAVAGVVGHPASAQFGGGQGGGGFGGGGFGGGGQGGFGGGTQGTGPGSGVVVDANGVLSRQEVPDPTGQLTKARVENAMAGLEGDLAKISEMRKVSLTRLERAVAEKIAAGSGPDEIMKNLAGITRIEYVFCYPETGDIVIAGPAEPFAEDLAGRMRGIATGRPVVELQDVVTALRAFPPQAKKKTPVVYCSIDPTEEGLQRMQQFLMQFGRSATPNDTQFIVDKLQETMGKQVITVGGVPATTHFAQVLVEADYRMKLIGINLEQPPVRLTSYVDRANPAAVSRNALERWYFVPDYQCVRVADDAMAMQIVGEGVKLVGEAEAITSQGGRQVSGAVNRASQHFTSAFTKVYPELAEKSPVYAQLRNCIDMAVVAAFIQEHDLYGQVDWAMDTFGSEEKFPVETYNAPEQVATAVNAIWKGRTLMTPIGGGVHIEPNKALAPENLLKDEEGKVASERTQLAPKDLTEGQWWWD
ncbi:DUF1598 domain-containing protein [Aeoliella sp. SH292]|uniref:DUF1598 domain-containing protein n=1 Tax=Aeoliella sp. SH292 TaxID=3454464 RepID=UPI003F955230